MWPAHCCTGGMRQLVHMCFAVALCWAPAVFAAESGDPAVSTGRLPDEPPPPPSAAPVASAIQADDAAVLPEHTAPPPPPGAVSPFAPRGRTEFVQLEEPGSLWVPPTYSPLPDAPSLDPDSEPTRRQWYGWQNLLVDAGSIVVFAVGADADSGSLMALGVGGYFAGGPIVHAAHGHGGKAWGSFGLRAGMPLGGALIGAGIGAAAEGDCDGDFCGLGAAIFAGVGLVLGMAGAITIDAAAVAREDAPVDQAATHIRIAPSVALTPKGAFTGLSGTF